MPLAEDIKRSLQDLVYGGPRFARAGIARRFGRARRMTVPVPGGGTATIRSRDSDFAIVRQVFLAGDYSLAHAGAAAARVRARHDALLAAGRVPVIVDAGANIGAASLWFRREYPRATVVAIEPDPANVEVLRANTAADTQVVVIPAAIGSAPGFASLTADGGSSGIRSARDAAGCPIVTMAEAVARVPGGTLLIAKIDIEGFESDLFAADTGWIDEAALLYIEPHDWMLPDRGTSRAFQAEMGRRDFDIFLRGENLIYARR